MSKLSRRQVLRAASLASCLAVLTACGATPTPQVIKEVVTQVVEKEVTKMVEGTPQVVKETVVVEVEKEVVVTATPEAVAAATPAAAQPVKVDIWIQQYSLDVMKGSAQAYSEAHPEVTVNMVPTPLEETSNKLLAALAAGSGGPDAAFIQYTDMMKFTLRGAKGLSDLTPFMEGRRDDWVKWCLDIVTTDEGRTVGLPEDLGLVALFYRRDVLDAAGEPSDPESVGTALATWDDIIVTGSKVTKEGERWMMSNASEYFDILRQRNEQRYFDDGGQPIVNGPDFVEGGEYIARARQAGIDAKWEVWGADWNAAMVDPNGKIVLYPCAAWWDQIIQPSAPDTRGEWGVIPLPAGYGANWGGSYFVFPQMSQNRAQAFDFCSFVEASEEGLRLYMKSGKFLPGYKKFYSDPIFTTPDPFYSDQAWLQLFSAIAEQVPPIHLDLNDSVASEVLGQAVARILDEGADPQQALDEANEEIANRIAGT